ncbi:MAG: DUF4358 domain-containing protein [Clostridia bacterium]|nr:DUF4358 domain-containing protein [Clostridia bacterium]
MKKILACLLCGLMLFAFSACGETETPKQNEEVVKDVSVQAIQDKIVADLGLGSVNAMKTKALTNGLGITEESIKATASFYADGEVFDEEIYLIEATDAAAADDVEAKLNTRLESLRSQAANYSAESKAILDECDVLRKGNYVALFFSTKRAEMEKIFEDSF